MISLPQTYASIIYSTVITWIIPWMLYSIYYPESRQNLYNWGNNSIIDGVKLQSQLPEPLLYFHQFPSVILTIASALLLGSNIILILRKPRRWNNLSCYAQQSCMVLMYFIFLEYVFGYSFSLSKTLSEMLCWPLYMSQFFLFHYHLYHILSCHSSFLYIILLREPEPSTDPFSYKSDTHHQDSSEYYKFITIISYLGNWLGSFVIPLDWGQLWQKFPIPNIYTMFILYSLGPFVYILKQHLAQQMGTLKNE